MVLPGRHAVRLSTRVGSRFQESRRWWEIRLPMDACSVSCAGTLFLCAGRSELCGSTDLLNLEALQCLASCLIWHGFQSSWSRWYSRDSLAATIPHYGTKTTDLTLLAIPHTLLRLSRRFLVDLG